jgi:hypothetical protein
LASFMPIKQQELRDGKVIMWESSAPETTALVFEPDPDANREYTNRE